MKKFYYSALDKQDTAVQYPALNEMKYKNSVAFTHDIETGMLPSVYDKADILYAEIPWQHGYDKFNQQAGIEGSTFKDFMGKVYQIVNDNAWKKPVIIICGKKMLPMLPRPSHTQKVMLNGYPALAVMYNMNLVGLDFSNNYNLIDSLAKKYSCIGDFACGYGNSGMIFADNGKDFVLSDINPHCIGYIEQEAPKWYEDI